MKGAPGLLAGLLLVMAASTVRAAPPPVVLATHELCPYGCTRTDGRFDGVAVQVARCAFARLDWPLDVRVYPWPRAQLLAREGSVDGFFGASRNAERDTYAVLSATIAPQQWIWYLRADNPLDPKQADFRARATVASYIGANMLDWLETEQYRVMVRPADTQALLDALLARRVDAVLANGTVMERLLGERGLAREVKSTLAQDKPLGVYFTRRFLANKPKFMTDFNAAVAACTRLPEQS